MGLKIKKRFHPNDIAKLRSLEKDPHSYGWSKLDLDTAIYYYLICLQEDFERCATILEGELYHTHKKGLCVVPRDIFKHFNASMISKDMVALINETTVDTVPVFLSKSLNKYYPPSFALYIGYLLAISLDKPDVAELLEVVIRNFLPLACTMGYFLEMCLNDPDVSTRITELYKEVSVLAEDLEVKEDIEKHDTLNPILFDGDKLKPEVKEKAIEVADELLQMMNDSGLNIKLQDLILTGSNASYNYTKDSDIDLHLVADMSDIDDPAGLYPILFDNFKGSFNKKFDIAFYDIPVEVYIESADTARVSKGVYSIYKDAWITEPKNEEIPDIDLVVVDQKLAPWVERYKELTKKIDKETCTDSSEIEAYIDDIYELRQKGLSTEGEYSTENLIFKEIRNLGYLDKLKELCDVITTNRLSLTDNDLAEDYAYGTKQISGEDYIDTSVASTFATKELLQGDQRGNYLGIIYNIVNLTPNQYFELCSVIQDSSVSDLKRWVSFDKRTLEQLTSVITDKNEQFPLPFISFADNYDIGNQEGKHRMYVLGELFGWDSKKYPVMVIQNKANYKPTGFWLQKAIK
jgi:hypothetical protein